MQGSNRLKLTFILFLKWCITSLYMFGFCLVKINCRDKLKVTPLPLGLKGHIRNISATNNSNQSQSDSNTVATQTVSQDKRKISKSKDADKTS